MTDVDMTAFQSNEFDNELKRRQAEGIGARCRGCGLWWSGTNTAHCSRCHQTFTTVWGFDAHRIGGDDDRVCVNPALIRDGGEPLRLVERGGAQAWARPIDEAARDRLAASRPGRTPQE